MRTWVQWAQGARPCPGRLHGDSRLGSFRVDPRPLSTVVIRRRLSRQASTPQAIFKIFDRVKPQSKELESVISRLLSLAEGTNLGTKTDPETKKELLRLVDVLEDAQKGAPTTDSRINATWKLLWTTEKETLFIVQNAWIFGTKAGGVYQVIDVDNSKLGNVITFPPDGAFIVDSTLSREGRQRLNFKFTAAKLKLPSRTISLPPYGQGWFDTVYIDNRIRVAKDIRGDTLIVTRDGPPRSFD
eukprot:jgi/Botrbrau1/713/Bobra.160_2s0036.1